MLVRLVDLTVDLAGDDFWGADLHFVTLAAHGLDQNTEVQLAAPGNLVLVGVVLLDAQRDVGHRLAHQAVADVAGRDVLAFFTSKGTRVWPERHGNRRLVHRQHRQGFGIGEVSHGLTDTDILETRNGHNVARVDLFDINSR